MLPGLLLLMVAPPAVTLPAGGSAWTLAPSAIISDTDRVFRANMAALAVLPRTDDEALPALLVFSETAT